MVMAMATAAAQNLQEPDITGKYGDLSLDRAEFGMGKGARFGGETRIAKKRG